MVGQSMGNGRFCRTTFIQMRQKDFTDRIRIRNQSDASYQKRYRIVPRLASLNSCSSICSYRCPGIENYIRIINLLQRSFCIKGTLFASQEETFWVVVNRFLKDFSWKNFTTQDFLNSIKNYTSVNLENWMYAYLYTEGVTQIKINAWNNQTIEIQQKPMADGNYRSLNTKFEIFSKRQSESKLQQHIPAEATTVIKMPDLNEQITAILPNFNDEAYMLVILDAESTEFFLNNLNLLTQVQRMIVFRSICNEYLEGQSIQQILTKAKSFLIFEIKAKLMDYYLEEIKSLLFEQNFNLILNLAPSVFQLILEVMEQVNLNTNLINTQKIELLQVLQKWLCDFAIQKDHVQLMIDWIRGSHLKQFQFSENDLLSVLDLAMATKIITTQLRIQSANQNLQNQIIQERIYTSLLNIQEINNGSLIAIQLKESMLSFNSFYRKDELTHYGKRFFNEIKSIFKIIHLNKLYCFTNAYSLIIWNMFLLSRIYGFSLNRQQGTSCLIASYGIQWLKKYKSIDTIQNEN